MEILTALACLASLNSSLSPYVNSGSASCFGKSAYLSTCAPFDKEEAEMALKHIESFDEKTFSKTKNEISFSGYKSLKGIYGKSDYKCSDFLISFEITYISEIDLGFMDLTFLDPTKEKELSRETVHFFPFLTRKKREKTSESTSTLSAILLVKLSKTIESKNALVSI